MPNRYTYDKTVANIEAERMRRIAMLRSFEARERHNLERAARLVARAHVA